jgi:hypothetical protein
VAVGADGAGLLDLLLHRPVEHLEGPELQLAGDDEVLDVPLVPLAGELLGVGLGDANGGPVPGGGAMRVPGPGAFGPAVLRRPPLDERYTLGRPSGYFR